MQPVFRESPEKPRMNASKCPVPANWTSISGTSAASVAAHAAMRTPRPGIRRASASPMVNRPALRRGSASRNISSISDRAVLNASTMPS